MLIRSIVRQFRLSYTRKLLIHQRFKGKIMKDSRRNILKKVSAISIWTTPVVQSIVLPAHAQTSATTAAPTTAAPTTVAPTTVAPTTSACPDPVLASGDIVFSGNLTLLSDNGSSSNGALNATITNNSTVLVSLSGSFGPVMGESFTVTLPAQLQPGESAQFSINSDDSNICSISNLGSSPFNVTVTSLDSVCSGSIDISQSIEISPNC